MQLLEHSTEYELVNKHVKRRDWRVEYIVHVLTFGYYERCFFLFSDRNQDVSPFVSSTVAPTPQPEKQQLRKKRARMIAKVLTSLQDLAKAKRTQHLSLKKQPALNKTQATQARSLQAHCYARKDITVRAWMSRLEKRLDHIEAMIGRVEERLDAAFRRGAFF
ncbi:hypothetical protein NDU88_004015 [Pleurodeles waltl]|uniref:Uncharacterized protein n=1 Tax=Pleurodeles waltl TaxID=8319 RepID=A0AAV7SHJ7_PLEWA|nr:hypothetical protein NDU88_004015 [Pleurodeles waltl]